jgi:hypothetical protein
MLLVASVDQIDCCAKNNPNYNYFWHNNEKSGSKIFHPLKV